MGRGDQERVIAEQERRLAQVENLAGRLDESCNLLWPRIILTILRDLKALGSLQEPTGVY